MHRVIFGLARTSEVKWTRFDLYQKRFGSMDESRWLSMDWDG